MIDERCLLKNSSQSNVIGARIRIAIVASETEFAIHSNGSICLLFIVVVFVWPCKWRCSLIAQTASH